MMVRCARCHRKLKHPVYRNGLTYGSTCVRYIPDTHQEIAFLRNQVETLTLQVQQLMNSSSVVWKPLPLIPGNGDLGKGYGADHSQVMDELRSVLKDRIIN